MIPKAMVPGRSKTSGGNGQVKRTDGWANLFTSLGTSHDKRKSSSYESCGKIDDDQLANLYRDGGLGRRIAALPADDMTRNWFRISGDPEDKALQKLKDLSAQKHIHNGIMWSRAFGAGMVVMGVDDGLELSEPVNENAIRDIRFLKVFDRRECQVKQETIITDWKNKNLGEPELYRITPSQGGEGLDVHRSRVIRFDGNFLANRELVKNSYWHDSFYQSAYESVRQIGAVFDSSEFIVEDFVQTVIKMDGLMQLMASGQEDVVKARMDLLDKSRHVANTLMMDVGEDYAKHTASIAGLSELLDRFMMMLSAAVGIPVTLLMGRSPAGMNATGESDIRFYYDTIAGEQRNEITPRIEPLIRYIYRSKGMSEPEAWAIEWNPVREMSPAETSELYKSNAEGDQTYIQNGVLSPEEVAEHRFGGEKYNPNPLTIENEGDGDDGDGDDGAKTEPDPEPEPTNTDIKATHGKPGDPSDGNQER